MPSTLDISIEGIPDGSFMTVLDQADGTRIQRGSIVYTDEAMSVALPIDGGITVKGYVDDSLNPSSNGAYLEGVTVGSVVIFTPLSLFQSGEQGAWYDPSDLTTLYQDAAGTTPVTADGQPVGLMLDKSKGLQLGESVTGNTWVNSGFDALVPSGSGFTATKSTAGGTDLTYSSNTISTQIGKLYEITIDIQSNSLYDCSLALSQGRNVRTTTGIVRGTGVIKVIVESNVYTTGNFNIQLRATSPGTIVVNSISAAEVLGNHASQSVSTKRPTYNDTPDRLTLDKVDDSIVVNVPVGGWVGSMVIGTNEGTASYGVNIPAGDYTMGGTYFAGSSINGALIRDGVVSASDLAKVEQAFVDDGAKASYGDVTDFTTYWHDMGEITEFPLIDTSSGTNFNQTWRGCTGLTSFPLVDTSSGTNFNATWYNSDLTSFPLIDTSSGTNFNATWAYNNLTSFPLLDTSSGTSFSNAWRNNSLTSFPLIDTSSGTNFLAAWRDNTALSTFPANMFDNCLANNFGNAFLNTGLSQSSIDGILVSINSNGTSNGTFDQSGGSAPSATGEAAITAMRSRGWTVTVTGGF